MVPAADGTGRNHTSSAGDVVNAPLAVDRLGNALLRFDIGIEDDLRSGDPDIPLPLALVVASTDAGTLLVFNRWRKEWELPGGMIDPGETPRQAAGREFVEETNQQASGLEYVGRASFRLAPDARIEYAAVYRADVQEVQAFTANDEVERICWWAGSPIRDLSALDAEIARLASDRH